MQRLPDSTRNDFDCLQLQKQRIVSDDMALKSNIFLYRNKLYLKNKMDYCIGCRALFHIKLQLRSYCAPLQKILNLISTVVSVLRLMYSKRKNVKLRIEI